MIHTLHVSKRLKNLLPSLAKEEREQLTANIEADGRVTDPILYWHDGKQEVVVDGMHRYPIARRLGIPYQTERIAIGDTYEDVELWILNRQLGRRNLLSPQAIRKIRGELYNRLKGQQGGDHTSTKAKGQNVPLLVNAAEKIGEKAGVNPKTIIRDGARVAALAKCIAPIQKGINSGKIKATDAEVKTLSKLAPLNQNNIAKDLRGGVAKTVTEAMKKRKIKQPAGKKPPKKLDRKAYCKEWERAIGPVVRLVDKIAAGVGEKHCESHKTILRLLDDCTEGVTEWMGVE